MTTKVKPTVEKWRDSHDYKQAMFASEKLLDEPWVDPDDDIRTVCRQFQRMVERYDALAHSVQEAKAEERERIQTEMEDKIYSTTKGRMGKQRLLKRKRIKELREKKENRASKTR